MSGWMVMGEDSEAISHEGTLPQDWRTFAKAMLGYANMIGKAEALEVWESIQPDERAGMVRHGWSCWAPPGRWYGGEYTAWFNPATEPYPGWTELEDHDCGPVDPNEPCHTESDPALVCLGMGPDDDDAAGEALAKACTEAPDTVLLISAGNGYPWLSRIIGPQTIVVLE